MSLVGGPYSPATKKRLLTLNSGYRDLRDFLATTACRARACAYGMAESREVSRLDKPGLRRPTPGSGRPRFWFDSKAVSGVGAKRRKSARFLSARSFPWSLKWYRPKIS